MNQEDGHWVANVFLKDDSLTSFLLGLEILAALNIVCKARCLNYILVFRGIIKITKIFIFVIQFITNKNCCTNNGFDTSKSSIVRCKSVKYRIEILTNIICIARFSKAFW